MVQPTDHCRDYIWSSPTASWAVAIAAYPLVKDPGTPPPKSPSSPGLKWTSVPPCPMTLKKAQDQGLQDKKEVTEARGHLLHLCTHWRAVLRLIKSLPSTRRCDGVLAACDWFVAVLVLRALSRMQPPRPLPFTNTHILGE